MWSHCFPVNNKKKIKLQQKGQEKNRKFIIKLLS